MSKAIEEFELVNHGIDYPDYFQGCGMAFTDYTDVSTGIGTNCAEAIDDALESLAQREWNVEDMDVRIRGVYGPIPEAPSVTEEDGDDAYYYVSIRVK